MSAGAHAAPVAAVAARASEVLSGSYDGTVALWRVDVGARSITPLRRWALHGKGVNAVAWSPVGDAFATGASDGRGALVIGGDVRALLEHPVDVESVAFSADGAQLCTGGTDGKAALWGLDGTRLCAVPHGRTVGAVAALPGGGFVTGSNDRQLRWIDGAGRVRAASAVADGPIKAVALAGGHVFLSAHDGTVRRVAPGSREAAVVARFGTTPKALCGHGDDLYVATYDATVSRFRVAPDGDCALVARVRLPRAWGHAISAGDGFVALGSFDGRPVILDARGDGLSLVEDSAARVPCLSAMASTASATLAAGDAGEVYPVVDGRADTARPVAAFEGAITSLARHADDVIVGTWTGQVARVTAGGEVVPLGAFGAPVLRVAAYGDDVLAGLYTGGAVALGAARGEVRWALTESTGASKCVALCESYAAVTGRYDPLRVADRRSGRVLARLALDTPVSDAVAFRPRELGQACRLAVAAAAGEVWIVELGEGAGGFEARVVHRGGGHALPIKALAWVGPDDVAAGDYGGALRLHRVGRDSRGVVTVPSRLGISALCAAPGGLLASTFDGAVHLVPMVDP